MMDDFSDEILRKELHEDQIKDLDTKARIIQGKLEGLFRQSYSACTQHTFISHFRLSRSTVHEIVDLTNQLEEIVDKFEEIQVGKNAFSVKMN